MFNLLCVFKLRGINCEALNGKTRKRRKQLLLPTFVATQCVWAVPLVLSVQNNVRLLFKCLPEYLNICQLSQTLMVPLIPTRPVYLHRRHTVCRGSPSRPLRWHIPSGGCTEDGVWSLASEARNSSTVHPGARGVARKAFWNSVGGGARQYGKYKIIYN